MLDHIFSIIALTLVIACSVYLFAGKFKTMSIELDTYKKQFEYQKDMLESQKRELTMAREGIKKRDEELNAILKENPDWCNTKLPFDFKRLCGEDSKSAVPAPSGTTPRH